MSIEDKINQHLVDEGNTLERELLAAAATIERMNSVRKIVNDKNFDKHYKNSLKDLNALHATISQKNIRDKIEKSISKRTTSIRALRNYKK